jgi:hypothetical protein
MTRWLAAGFAAVTLTAACSVAPTTDAVVVEVHRSPTCDCCGAYEEYLAEQGFAVEPVIRDDVVAFKQGVGVPAELGSCHTSLVEGYWVEGHVPAEAIRRLLAEQPPIDGIALPGMPAGTPGMPGVQDSVWTVYAVTGGEASEFAEYRP